MFAVNRTDEGYYKFYSKAMQAYICKGKVDREQYGLIALPTQEFETEGFDESLCLFEIQDQDMLRGMSLSQISIVTCIHLLFGHRTKKIILYHDSCKRGNRLVVWSMSQKRSLTLVLAIFCTYHMQT